MHAAGVLDDGVIGSLTQERLRSVLAPKADAAWQLHELTEHMDLSVFVSVLLGGGAFGSPGQGNYAAANAFLDALAAQRRARGLPGGSFAWGLWEQASGMTGGLSESDISRMARAGLRLRPPEDGLDLFDAPWAPARRCCCRSRWILRRCVLRRGRESYRRCSRASCARPLVARVPATPRWRGAWRPARGRARACRARSRRGAGGGRAGHASSEAIDAQRTFKELGFDSLTAVELRNRFNSATGLRLPATLVFDYPTPAAWPPYLLGELGGAKASSTRCAPLPPRSMSPLRSWE